MIIKEITLNNFRNHEKYHLELNPDTTLIYGENGYGKTSILEAIYILTRGKSFRAVDSEIIKRGTDYYRIELTYDNGEKITATYDNKNKTFIYLDKKTRRLPKNGKYPTILFLPSDLNLISGSPSRHREYFDHIFSQFNEDYSVSLSRYEKALKQRNELLKDERVTPADLFSWNILLAKYGAKIHNLRKALVEELNESLEDTYHSIAENNDTVSLEYQSELGSISENDYLKKLEESAMKDLYLGHTSFGVHRDDYGFIFNNHKADGSASRGETRSFILALKFNEAKIVEQKIGKKPIVLLDDVFSELDEERRRALVKNFKDHQVIITSTEAI